MLKYTDYTIVFQEVPDEVSLAINLSGCPYRCKGCHSPHLQQETGEELSERVLSGLLQSYAQAITCVCFMGGDAQVEAVCRLATYVRTEWEGRLRTAWYSGNDIIDPAAAGCFDYVKTGPFLEALGGLDRRTTNQRLYRFTADGFKDITFKMQR